jgi:TolB-like protein/class 3 adenylate cyclase/tetratricopeptide (TPR) repeat protein
MAATRRLAAILAADISGYSRLMGVDEEETHERFKAHLGELVSPKIKKHRGRTVKNTGDGFLAEFASVVDAARCAAEIQRGMADRETELTEDRRIRFRIGINLGDVIAESNDIFGDGVNVAARLEALAEPGGICVSRVVRDQIRDKLPYGFTDLGEQSLKNIARPVRVYAMSAAAVGLLPAIATAVNPPAVSRNIRAHVAGAKGARRARSNLRRSPSLPAASAGEESQSSPRLSIVVLPFVNLSSDPEQEYFSDGITEDLTTDLSRIPGSFVIARNTAFTYKGKAIDAKRIGRGLGVRYVLEGSVRRSGGQIRINTQLIDVETGAHLWAERFDCGSGDLFQVQDEVTRRIASGLGVELIEAESERAIRERPSNPDAVDLTMQARALANKPPSPDQNARIRILCERALDLDPKNVDALVELAWDYIVGSQQIWTTPTSEAIPRAMGAVNHALTVDPRNARAFLVKSHAFAYKDQLDYRGQIDEALDAAETAIALDPNLAAAYAWLGRLYAKAGYPERTSTFVEQAMRLSPRDSDKGSWLYISGTSLLQMGDYDQAITTFRRSLVANPSLAISWCNLSAAYLGAGREGDARDALAEARRVTTRPLPCDVEEQLDAVRVQLALLRNGLWPYTVGGSLNSKRVCEALRAFQHHENLPETGVLDEITRARLGVTAGAE